MKPARQTRSIAAFAKTPVKRLVEALPRGEAAMIDHHGRHLEEPRLVETGSVLAVRHDQRDFGRVGGIGGSLDQRRHVGAAPRDEDGDTGARHQPVASASAPSKTTGAPVRASSLPSAMTLSPSAASAEHQRLGPLALDDQHHADAAIEGAQHLHLGDGAEEGEPGEDRRNPDAGKVDAGGEPLGQDPRDVVDEAAAGDVRHRLDPTGGAERLEERLDVDAGGHEKRAPEAGRGAEGRREVERHLRVVEELSDEREAVRMEPRRGEAENDVARFEIAPRQELAPLGGADREAGEVEVAPLIEPRHLGGLAADERGAGDPAALGDAGDDLDGVSRLELAGGEIVEEEQRLGALDDEIVDAHGDQIDADRVENAGVDGDLQLGADPVGGRDQDRVRITRRLEVEEPAESADLGIRSRSACVVRMSGLIASTRALPASMSTPASA